MMSGQDLIHFLEGGPIKEQKLELAERERGEYFRHACTSSSLLFLSFFLSYGSCGHFNFTEHFEWGLFIFDFHR